MGTREDRIQQERLWYHGEIAEAPGHPFYQRLNKLLDELEFDKFCEERCQQYYHPKMGRPSLAPGVYFRMVLIGYFEGLESDRGIAWRVADSRSLSAFLRYGMNEMTPDHVTLSKTRRLISEETHQEVFKLVLHEIAKRGFLKGKTVGIDATTLEANAAMKALVNRETGETYDEYLKTLLGDRAKDAASRRREDSKREKSVSNTEWSNPNDPDAQITKTKSGRIALAYKLEQAVDMETGAIVAITAHGGATGDTTSIQETLPIAGELIADEIATKSYDGNYEVNQESIEEVVTDKGYHSNDIVAAVTDMGVTSFIAVPERKNQNWNGKEDLRIVVHANRDRVESERGKALLRQRGEKLERPFAHQYSRGRMRRLHVRGLTNVRKRCLMIAAAFNLALLLQNMYGAGMPRSLADRRKALYFAILCAMAR